MQTPIKRHENKRVYTTAVTEGADGYTHSFIKSRIDRIDTEVYNKYDDIKKQLDFNCPKRFKIAAEIAHNNKKTSSQYRKSMINYLNNKFTTALSQTNKEVNLKPPKKQPLRQSKYQDNLTIFFKQFINQVKELKIKELTEYQVGHLLQNMSFIHDVLQQRESIKNLWKILDEPSLLTLFLYLARNFIFHCDGTAKTQKNDLFRIQKLFENQGAQYNLRTIEISDRIASNISCRRLYNAMSINRQKRHTFSSLSQSKIKQKI